MMSIDGGHDDVVDVHEAARLAGRTAETIRRWVWSGRLPARRRGRKLLLSRVDVVRLAGGTQVEVGDLVDWHRHAVEQAGRTRRAGAVTNSAADLVLSDRWERDDEATDARR